jgi:hypothetical protein
LDPLSADISFTSSGTIGVFPENSTVRPDPAGGSMERELAIPSGALYFLVI